MRKNYFAKKFVAYSMAFAVAFSTLTVSPVFIKEAKAATVPTATPMTSITGDQFIVGNVTTNVAASTSNITLEDVAKNINGAIATGNSQNTFYLTFTKGEDTEEQVNNGIKTLYKYETLDLAANMIGTTDPAVAAPVLVDFIADNPGVIDASAVKSAGVKWFKLEPIHGTFSHSTGITATPTETISYDAYYLNAISESDFGDTSDDGKLTFQKGKVSSNDCGLYLAVDATNPTKGAVFNVIQDTKLKAAPERTEFIVKSGSDANLIVHASNNSGNISYSWRKGTKTLSSTSDVCKIEKVDGTKTGNYTCVVSDGSGEVTLRNIKLSVSENALGAKPVYKTVVKGLVATTDGATNPSISDKLIGGTAELTSSVPANENYRYVWLDKNKSVESVTAANILNYDAKNNNIVINDKKDKYDAATKSHEISCYTLTADDYEALKADVRSTTDGDETIGGLLVELSKAKNDVEKKEINDYIRKIENENAAAVKTESLYQEDYIFVREDDKLTNSVNLVKAVGDNVICEAPSKDLYTKCTASGHSADETITANPEVSFVRTELQGNDFGNHPISTTYKCSNATSDTKTATTYYNIIYKSDLTATAENTNIVAKIGSKEVELKVNASSACGLDYTWTKYTKNSDAKKVTPKVIATSKTSTHKISTVADTDIYVPEKLDELGNLVAHDYNYYECEVSNGIEKKVIKFTLSQEGGYKVYDQKPLDGTQVNVARNDNGVTSYTVTGWTAIPGKNIVLNPYVVADKGVNITYKWYDITNSKEILSTTDTLDIPYTKPVTYVCVISDGENEFKLKYDLQNATVTTDEVYVYLRDDIEDQVYTGKEITPELNVGFALKSGGGGFTNYSVVSKLVAGTDYLVEYVENVNVGEARVKVTPTGLYKGVTETFKFYINRADNTLEIADRTVVLGGSVQPKTVKNTAKATLSYAYFTDKECTNEIEVPSKVGTYYVKATSAATLNYKEATSNVATVKVVPGKVKMLGTSRTASSVKLNWNKTTGATSYRVYYKAPGAKSYKVFKNTTATRMNVTGLASATTYTFAVKAYAKTAGYSKVYATKKTTTAPAKVATPSVTTGSKKATVKFTKVARATGYQIYMTKGNGKYVKVKTTTSTSFTKTGLAKGATYKFKVRAYKTVGSNTYYGAFSSAKAVVVK